MSAAIEKGGIVVRPADDDELDRWNDLVERSPQANMFHYREALEVQADHANVDFHPLIGYKGQEPVGLFPVFEKRRRWLTRVYSAAPALWISYLGPAQLNHLKLKQRKRERRNKRFVTGALDWIERELDPEYVQVRPDSAYRDVRPFQWRGFDVDMRHTYEVDLTPGEREVLMSFSSDARNNVRTDGDYRVYEGGPEQIEAIISQVAARYEQQGESYGVTPEFVTALYERLPDGAVRPYACEIDGEFASGIVVLEFGDTVYRWQGGAKHDHDLPVTDLLDWAIMTNAIDRGLSRYDLVGANEERLCGYKAKFDPDLRPYYRMENTTLSGDLIMSTYRKLAQSS